MSDAHKIFCLMKSEWEKREESNVFFSKRQGSYEDFCKRVLQEPERLNSHISWHYAARLLNVNGVPMSEDAISFAYYDTTGRLGNWEGDEFEEMDDPELLRRASAYLESFKARPLPEKVDLDHFL